MLRAISFGLLVLLVIVLFWCQQLLLLPNVPSPYDKLVHAGTYCLALLWAAGALRPTFWHCLLVALTGLAVGGLQEWHQSYLPGRVASLDDWLADLAGVLLGLLLCWCLSCWQRRYASRMM